MNENLVIRITSKYFCAGLYFSKGRIICAPILRKHLSQCKYNITIFKNYCRTKGWKWEEIKIERNIIGTI